MKKLSTILIASAVMIIMGCMAPMMLIDFEKMDRMNKYCKYNETFGYTDTITGDKGYQIEYVDKGRHGDLEVKKKCMIRAAEIGRHKGYTYFLIVDEGTKIIANDIMIEEKTIIEDKSNEEGKNKIEVTKTPSHYKENYKTISQITVQYTNQKERYAISIQEILTSAVTEGYLQI